jgi:hypothetical protein
MDAKLQQIVRAIDARFLSGNSVPVERAMVKRDEWETLKLQLFRDDNDRARQKA